MKAQTLNSDRTSEIMEMAKIAKNEKERDLLDQLERLREQDDDLGELETETLELKGLFDSLSGFNNLEHVKLSCILEFAFESYIREHPHMTEDAFSTHSNLSRLISQLYLYSGLIDKKLGEYTRLVDEFENIRSSAVRKAS